MIYQNKTMKKIVNESLNEWLNEQKEREEPTYGCVMLDSNMKEWDSIHLGGIDPKDVYKKPLDDSYGLEDNPHVTILYGIHEDDVTPEQMINVIEESMEEVIVMISEISIFEKEEYDVVKYDIPVTKQLLGYRKMFVNNFENTQSFPFHPHMTIAYVKPGMGKKYVSNLDEPFEITFNKGVYSWHEKGEDGNVKMKRKEYIFKDKEDEDYVL